MSSMVKFTNTRVFSIACICFIVLAVIPDMSASKVDKILNTAENEVKNVIGNTGGKPATTADSFRASQSFYYPNQQTQYQQQPQSWNRDSYSDAASDFGYNLDGQAHAHSHSAGHAHAHYAPSYNVPNSYGLTGDYDDTYEGGILGGIGGLLGLKGLKGLGILGLIKAGFLGIIPLFFLFLPALLIIPLLLIFLPIPVITVPTAGTGRGIFNPFSGINLNEWSGKVANLARSVAESDKCIERISCEMSRISRGSIIDRTIKRVISRFEPHFPAPLQRMTRAYLEASGCRNYGCFVMDDFHSKKPL